MHRAQPSLSIPLPRLDGGLVSNLVALAAMVAFCVILSLVTWWWVGSMLGCLLAFGCVVWYQRGLAVESAEPVKVTPLKKTG